MDTKDLMEEQAKQALDCSDKVAAYLTKINEIKNWVQSACNRATVNYEYANKQFHDERRNLRYNGDQDPTDILERYATEGQLYKNQMYAYRELLKMIGKE
jgi:hypothetical protein